MASPRSFWNEVDIHGNWIGAELVEVNTLILEEYLQPLGLPALPLAQSGYLNSLTLMHQGLFAEVDFSYRIGEWNTNDFSTFATRQGYHSLALKVGYNVARAGDLKVSPYVGARYFRFRHQIRPSDAQITLVDYLAEPNLDLRLMQYAAVGGLNLQWVFAAGWSAGVYGEYLYPLQDHAMVRVPGSRITDVVDAPLGNWLIGVKMGICACNRVGSLF